MNTKTAQKPIKVDFTVAAAYTHRKTKDTCILISAAPETYLYIAASNLTLAQTLPKPFKAQWEAVKNYPVRRAAELYLRAPIGDMSPQARGLLGAIVENPATAYDKAHIIDPETFKHHEETKMAEAAKKPAKPTGKPAVPPKPVPGKPAAKPVPGKPAAAAAVKPAPVKPVPGKPAGKPAAVPAARGRTADDTTQYVVGDDSTIKRGVVREFVDEAVKMKKFTRSSLVAKLADTYGEERMTRYFYYCTGHGVFVQA
jgi:hypothetical protein